MKECPSCDGYGSYEIENDIGKDFETCTLCEGSGEILEIDDL